MPRTVKRDPIESGRKFCKWTVQETTATEHVRVRCECGKISSVRAGNLLSGKSTGCRSCGSKKPGVRRTRLGRSWSDMMRRCRSPNYANAHWYRERGVDVCVEWEDPEVFFQWARSSGYRDDLTIDRVDNNKGYFPANCRWATRQEQARNRRSNVLLDAFGETRKVFEWTEDPRCKVKKADVIHERLRNGWSGQEAISIPLGQSRRTVLAWGERKSIPEWFQDERCFAASFKIIRARLRQGWSPEDAIGLPEQVRGRKHRASA
jgi:hypothetical protein